MTIPTKNRAKCATASVGGAAPLNYSHVRSISELGFAFVASETIQARDLDSFATKFKKATAILEEAGLTENAETLKILSNLSTGGPAYEPLVAAYMKSKICCTQGTQELSKLG